MRAPGPQGLGRTPRAVRPAVCGTFPGAATAASGRRCRRWQSCSSRGSSRVRQSQLARPLGAAPSRQRAEGRAQLGRAQESRSPLAPQLVPNTLNGHGTDMVCRARTLRRASCWTQSAGFSPRFAPRRLRRHRLPPAHRPHRRRQRVGRRTVLLEERHGHARHARDRRRLFCGTISHLAPHK